MLPALNGTGQVGYSLSFLSLFDLSSGSGDPDSWMDPSGQGSRQPDPCGFCFSSPSMLRPPAAGKGQSGPRSFKLRKQSGGAAEDPRPPGLGHGYNTFRPVGSAEFGFVVGVGASQGPVEGMAKLRIGGDRGQSLGIEERLRKLGIGGDKEEAKPVFGFPGLGNVGGKKVEAELPEELERKLKIEGRGNSDGIGRDAEEGSIRDQIKKLDIKEDAASVGNESSRKGIFGSGYIGEESKGVLAGELGNKLNVGNAGGDSAFPGFREGNKGMPVKDEQSGQVPEYVLHTDTRANVIGEHSFTFSSSGSVAAGILNGRPEKTDAFVFTSRQNSVGSPFVEFTTPIQKGKAFSGSNQKMEFASKSRATKTKKKREKVKQPTKVHLWPGQDFVSMDGASQEIPEASESYSPMDISPYQDTAVETLFSREASVASHESFSLESHNASVDSLQKGADDAIDEDLLVATQRMDINEEDVKCTEAGKEPPEYCACNNISSELPPDDYISGAETESFKSANEEVDFVNDFVSASVENEANSSTNIEGQDSGTATQFYSCRSSVGFNSSGFTFSASSPGQESPVHHQKKKNRSKIISESYSSTTGAKAPYASSSLLFTLLTGASLPLSPSRDKNLDLPTPLNIVGDNSELLREQEIEKETDLATAASTKAQEACEKWRLRGNQAYKNGDLSKAEDYYTQGIDCISRNETSRSCLRALVLCHSNRAATRMSLGRMRDALRDCKLAADVDPTFLRVQLRAANCCLALGEVKNAAEYFSKCLQLGSDVCVDRKIAVEASEGLQKAQKVSECIQHSAELLRRRKSSDKETALEVISEALLMSPYSEKLLEMKAECFFLLRRYEEVVMLCEQSLDSAEKNLLVSSLDNKLGNMEGSEHREDSSIRPWRSHLTALSFLHLGRLEDAISSLEKQGFAGESGKLEEPLTSLAVTLRELLHHKTAGNEAFQAGKHSEAIELYTAALSRNIESRPFAAICYCNRAAAFKSLGQIVDAIADCNLAIALDGNYVKAISRRATLYEMIRDYGQAATDLQRLVAVLSKLIDEKTSSSATLPINLVSDLRQARLCLSMMEEEGRKEIPLDMYLILGCEPSASASDIKKAYRKAALRHHPDKAGQSLARGDSGDDSLWKEIGEEVHKDADRLFKMIGEAYAVLSDPAKRSQYDLEEEARNAQKRRGGSTTFRTYRDTHTYPFERSSGRRQ